MVAMAPAFVAASGTPANAEDPIRNVLIEVYYHESDPEAKPVIEALKKLQAARGGITSVLRNLEEGESNQKRLGAILQHFKVDPKSTLVIYGCNQVIHNISPANSLDSQLASMLRLEVFVRTGCPRCASAKSWLPRFTKEYPALELVYRDIATDPAHAARLSQLVQKHRTAAATVPVFHFCDALHVGFQNESATGDRLRAILSRWTHEASRAHATTRQPQPGDATQKGSGVSSSRWQSPRFFFALRYIISRWGLNEIWLPTLAVVQQSTTTFADEPPDLPLPADDLLEGSEVDLPLPGLDTESESAATEYIDADDQIDLPLFGRLSASALGIPLFTLAVGLIDGFNPCAMWVLLFLLSILVNLKSRVRMLAIAGTFVVVSGLAYFIFMAAWLNVFMLIGYLRTIQISLALMAIVIGAIHIKDFFAFKKGLSLSIPESAKPGIYARVRAIVTAEHLTGAILGAITLAVLVNLVELLCTAGLPALYTNVLMQHGYSSWVKYGYLALYIVAYMFDDALMVAIVTLTLSRKKMQESHGRWLKLISGSAILLLGVVMLFKPEWLH